MVKNAELLRQEYNQNFTQPIDNWSCTRVQLAEKYVTKTLGQLAKFNFNIRKGMKAMDVGCAKGYITEAFRLAGFESYGLDYSDVAIQMATERFPECHFIHQDGFKPSLEQTFDLIFCRGFSGSNTHDLKFVAEWANRYISRLNPGGYFILAFSSDFSGKEMQGETVNWSMQEIDLLGDMLDAKPVAMFFIPDKYALKTLIKKLIKWIVGKKRKDYFYLVYTH